MNIHILDTRSLYKEMLSLPDDQRNAFFDERFLQPFAPMFERMGMPRNPAAFSCLALSGADAAACDMLNQLTAASAWEKAKTALEGAVRRCST